MDNVLRRVKALRKAGSRDHKEEDSSLGSLHLHHPAFGYDKGRKDKVTRLGSLLNDDAVDNVFSLKIPTSTPVSNPSPLQQVLKSRKIRLPRKKAGGGSGSAKAGNEVFRSNSFRFEKYERDETENAEMLLRKRVEEEARRRGQVRQYRSTTNWINAQLTEIKWHFVFEEGP